MSKGEATTNPYERAVSNNLYGDGSSAMTPKPSHPDTVRIALMAVEYWNMGDHGETHRTVVYFNEKTPLSELLKYIENVSSVVRLEITKQADGNKVMDDDQPF